LIKFDITQFNFFFTKINRCHSFFGTATLFMPKLEWNNLGAELALTCYKNQCSQQQANSMTPVAKHHRKKKRECNNCINCRICFLISCNTAEYQRSLGLGVFSVFIAKLQNKGSILNWLYPNLGTLIRHSMIYLHELAHCHHLLLQRK